MSEIIVKNSKIKGKGVFTARNFKKGEIILKWKSKQILTQKQVYKLPNSEKHYISTYTQDEYLLQQAPERYVNHSCDPNTKVKNNCDIAVRNIGKDEEITSDYSKDNNGIQLHFKCNCGSKNCRENI